MGNSEAASTEHIRSSGLVSLSSRVRGERARAGHLRRLFPWGRPFCVLLLAVCGCAATLPPPSKLETTPPISDAEWIAFRKVAVVPLHTLPEAKMEGVPEGGGRSPNLGLAFRSFALFGLVGVAADFIVQGVICSVENSSTGNAADRMEPTARDRMLAQARSSVADLQLQDDIARRVSDLMGKRPESQILLMGDAGPKDLGISADYRSLAGQGVGAVVEVGVLEKGFTASDNGHVMALGLFLTVRLRVVRTADGQEMYTTLVKREGTRWGVPEWNTPGDDRFGRELEYVSGSVARAAVESLFPRPPRRPSGRASDPSASASRP